MGQLEEARRLAEMGHDAAAIAIYEKELHNSPTPVDRAGILADLSAAYWRSQRITDAVVTARESVALSQSTGDAIEARARFALGTALLMQVDGDPSNAEFDDAITEMDQAATIFQRLGRIDFASALLTMADALRWHNGEVADSLYRRTLQEVMDERWKSSEAEAAHANHLSGRAFAGLGFMAADGGDQVTAEKRFEQSINFLLASGSPMGKPIVEAIATTMESMTGDAAVGQHIRDAARDTWP